MRELMVIASGNPHKAGEIRAILGDGFEYRTLRDCTGYAPGPETGSTFEANALLKARELAAWIAGRGEDGLWRGASGWVLADDSGLEVEALGGAPGVHSARFAGLGSGGSGNSPDAANNEKLLRLLGKVAAGDRGARFRCCLALAPFGSREVGERVFEGTCEGEIGWVAAGSSGFGYDPLFLPRGQTGTLAELGEEVKNRISHRAAALRKLQAHLAAR